MYHTQREQISIPAGEVEEGTDEWIAQRWLTLPEKSRAYISKRNPSYFEAVHSYWVDRNREEQEAIQKLPVRKQPSNKGRR